MADDAEIRNKINAEIQDKEAFTTSFVLREFLRTIIKDIAYIHRIVENIDEDQNGRVVLSSLVLSLAHGTGNFSDRAARREQYVVASILYNFQQTIIPRTELLRYLEYIAQQWIVKFFDIPQLNGDKLEIDDAHFLTSLDEPADEMKRWVASQRPIPPPPPFPRKAAEWLDTHKDLVQRVEEHVLAEEARKRDTRLLALLEKLKNKNSQYDFLTKLRPNTRGNWALGDLLIAMEAIVLVQDISIYTTDNHYQALGRALQLQRYAGYLPIMSPLTKSSPE